MAVPVFVRLRPVVAAGKNNIVPFIKKLVPPKQPFKKNPPPQRRPTPSPEIARRPPRPGMPRNPNRRRPIQEQPTTRRPLRPNPQRSPVRRRPIQEQPTRRPQNRPPAPDPPSPPRTPQPPRPPSPIEQANSILNAIRRPIQAINQILDPFGTQSYADAIADGILEAIDNLKNLGEKQRPRPSNPQPNPEPNPQPNFIPLPADFRLQSAIAVFAFTIIVGEDPVSGGVFSPDYQLADGYESWAIIEGVGQSIGASMYVYSDNLDEPGVNLGDRYLFIWSIQYWPRYREQVLNNGGLSITFPDDFEPFGLIDVITSPALDLEPPIPAEPTLFPEFIIIPAPTPEEDPEMPCDLSPLQSILRAQQTQIANLTTAVNTANLGINANIDQLKPPINQINATTQTISSKADDLINNLTNVRDIANATRTNVTNVGNTVNSTATTVQNVSTKVDDLASGLTNVRDIARATGDKVDDVGNLVRNTADKVDDVGNAVRNTADKVDDVGRNLNNIGNRINDIWNKIGENFTKTMERFDKLAKWLKLPLLFDALSLIVVLHNAAMLSANLIQTLGQIIDTALNIMNLKGDDEQPFNISEILGQQASNFMKSILGEDNWNNTNEEWKKAGRIYQAAANIIYSVQSITSSLQNILNFTAEATGKIGNALKKAGVVLENAYNWFPEQINAATARQTALNRMTAGLEGLNEAASGLSGAVSDVRNIQTTVIEIRKQKEEFDNAVSGLINDKTSTSSAAKDASKGASIPPSAEISPGS